VSADLAESVFYNLPAAGAREETTLHHRHRVPAAARVCRLPKLTWLGAQG